MYFWMLLVKETVYSDLVRVNRVCEPSGQEAKIAFNGYLHLVAESRIGFPLNPLCQKIQATGPKIDLRTSCPGSPKTSGAMGSEGS